MSYARSSLESAGFVNFPVTSEEYKNSKEGGMFVELWAIEPLSNKQDWMVCCGGNNIQTMYTESLVGTDKEPNSDNIEEMMRDNQVDQRFVMENKLFPGMVDMHKNDVISYDSIPMLACVTMGSTGWSGYSESSGMWRCCYNDLTMDGKNLYDTMKKLYGESIELLLVTWLDT